MSNKTPYPNIERFNPSECISRKLLKCNRIVSAVFRQYLLPLGVSNSQASILFVVSKKPMITQSELVNILSLEKSTISRNMQRLLQNGILEKVDSKQIQLTKKGSALLEKIIPEWEKAMAKIRIKLKKEGETSLNLVLQNLVK